MVLFYYKSKKNTIDKIDKVSPFVYIFCTILPPIPRFLQKITSSACIEVKISI